MGNRDIRISKLLSYLLRHASDKFDLTLDEHGYVTIDNVIAIIRRRYADFTHDDLLRIVRNDLKGRYEVLDDRIRARYGHSIQVAARTLPTEPPEVLYHGTASENVASILRDGLKPMRRQYVHLSTSPTDAVQVGRRHSQEVVVLRIRSGDAHRAGVEFLREATVFLAKHIPSEFIESIETG